MSLKRTLTKMKRDTFRRYCLSKLKLFSGNFFSGQTHLVSTSGVFGLFGTFSFSEEYSSAVGVLLLKRNPDFGLSAPSPSLLNLAAAEVEEEDLEDGEWPPPPPPVEGMRPRWMEMAASRPRGQSFRTLQKNKYTVN